MKGPDGTIWGGRWRDDTRDMGDDGKRPSTRDRRNKMQACDANSTRAFMDRSLSSASPSGGDKPDKGESLDAASPPLVGRRRAGVGRVTHWLPHRLPLRAAADALAPGAYHMTPAAENRNCRRSPSAAESSAPMQAPLLHNCVAYCTAYHVMHTTI
ncbi:hypothetical protein BO71DRAFT_424534 [Aspergillus ellipticus CBS 707.79]|uniref:Uncharacterized protein n=1 Tax=Aspergillus ellipticus CBS 707.79 TaxID=1448320 RepID=A0A319DR56_9EURO|nr:hypothetical protein BO71DRAFT_424534 [Aspergillus ellipticus CBS 707.79]